VVVLPIKGSKATDIKLVLQIESRNGKTWFPAGSILPNEAHVVAAVRESFEETSLILIVNDLTMLSGKHVRVPLPARQCSNTQSCLALGSSGDVHVCL
jgi:8-oxo-dGTP pyrophosphatase MutT (NUDIX family)